MPRKTKKLVLSIATTACLAFLLLASGFLACAAIPQTTELLAARFSTPNANTAFTHDDMVSVAAATRDYSFGSHSEDELIRTIYEANENGLTRAESSHSVLIGAPRLDGIDPNDTSQIETAFSNASERFVYSKDAISHLDDCYSVAVGAYIAIAIAAIALAACIFALKDRGTIGRATRKAGTIVLATFCILGVWAALDFDGMFTMFHMAFFSQGNWTFPADSLLICALPTEFWMGMGAVWLATTSIASILSILIGKHLARPHCTHSE